MKVFTCTDFKGHYPVGAAAVVVAESKAQAFTLLKQRLLGLGLFLEDDASIEELPLRPNAVVLHDGDY